MSGTNNNFKPNGRLSPAEKLLAMAEESWDLPEGPGLEKATEPLCEPWPEPEPLGGKLPPVAALTPEMLPVALRSVVEDVASRMQVPLDFPGVVAVATLAGLVGRRACIQPKQHDCSWVEPGNLWGGIVAEPGSMKSPVIASITAPAKELEAEWWKEHESARQEYELLVEAADLELQAWKKAKPRPNTESRPRPPKPPTQKRLMTQDATFESLHAILANNPGGLFLLRDELVGWLAGLERQGREQERTFCLEGWNGNSAYTMDRVGRGTIHVPNNCLSVFGAIQPSRLRVYLADVLRGGPANDGLMQRFQLLVWPDPPGAGWRYSDTAPDAAAARRAREAYRRLALMDPENPARFRFDAEAQALFIDFLTDLENRIRNPGTEDLMRAHLAKYRKLMPVLAMLFALADGAQEVCTLHHARMAAAWCDYLETHARRVYAAQASPERAVAHVLGWKLAAGELGRPGSIFKLREVYRKGWSGLGAKEDVLPALRCLEELGWVRKVPKPEGKQGRNSEEYTISPRLEARHVES